MALMRWDPFAELDSLHGQLNEVFNHNLSQSHAHLSPVIDVYSEDDKQLIVEAHLPNFAEDEITVDIQDHALTIKAEHHEKEEDKKKRQYVVRESSNSFYRRVALPKQADEDAIKAHFEKGVLKVTVPFKELPKPKRVSIGSGNKKK